jgi:hypothetical protein
VADQLVGTPIGAGAVQTETLVESGLTKALSSKSPSEALESTVRDWREHLGAPAIALLTTAVLSGVTSRTSVPLATDASVRPMTDREVCSLLDAGLLRMGFDYPVAQVPRPTCIALTQSLPRVIGHSQDATAAQRIYDERDAKVEAGLMALRLAGYAPVDEYTRLSIDGRGGMMWSSPAAMPFLTPGIPVRAIDGRRLRSLFTACAATLAAGGRTAIALRRYSRPNVGRLPEDRFLDLWIALEALFSPDGGGETTYQVALNAANFVRLPNRSRQQVFEGLKASYALRSDLVHGRQPGATKLRRLDKQRVESVSAVADDLGEFVRLALRRALKDGLPEFTSVALGEAPRGR